MKTKQLDALKISLLEDMREYMEDVAADGDEPDYSEADIGKCESILDTFLTKVRSAKSGDTEFVMGAVKEVVLALNELNEGCNHSLIETDQREQICDLIIQSAAAVGVGDGDEDITEEWREW
jgi:hypothetical protein